MPNTLSTILASKRDEVAAAKQRTPLERVRETALAEPPPRNFFRAVTREPRRAVNLIAEIKKASPSAGVIREDFDPVAIARRYAAAGADALSVLTDELFFQGKLEYIQQVRAAVELPVLRKDFVIDEYQVYEARAAGADAILLIAEALEVSQMIDLQILATELHMTCLIEVHDMENLIRVRDRVIGFPHRSYSLIGINNRDLRTFKTSIGTTLRMAELLESREVLVSESGIASRFDIDKLVDVGVRAVLVGETLMRSDDVAGKVNELLGPAKSN